MDLGEIGVWTHYHQIGRENAGEAARLAEELGYGTFWLGGSPRLPDVRPLLASTERLTVATGIVNIWQYDPTELAAEYAELSEEFPDRLLLGIGIGHPEATSDYTRPLSTTRAFLDGLDAAPTPVAPQHRCLAALRAKMLDLAGERTDGTHPYFVPVEHAAVARRRLGPGKLVAPEVACVIDTDQERARATARAYAKLYLGLSNYTNNLLELGYTEADLADGGSDRLIDAVIPHGSVQDVAGALRAHLDAGADHVCLQALGEPGIPRQAWTSLAQALLP